MDEATSPLRLKELPDSLTRPLRKNLDVTSQSCSQAA